MRRPVYLNDYIFDWEMLDVLLGGKSALDSSYFIGTVQDKEHVYRFLKGYGLDQDDPVTKAEIFGVFQESLQFIRRFFLKEGNPEGVDLKLPMELYSITDITDLFIMARIDSPNIELRHWAEIVFKIMHTILHVDKDLRSNYFSVIQTQIFDRFYKYIFRENDQLYVGVRGTERKIPLVNFETKAKKTRESVIIKLLHKTENVAEELFDRVGVRFITNTRFDALRVIKFLIEHSVIIPHNSKPSRSLNALVDLKNLRKEINSQIKLAIRNDLSEDRFLQSLERKLLDKCLPNNEQAFRNNHSKDMYRAIQFTCRQLIQYKDPFLTEFAQIKKMAKDIDPTDLSKRILAMDMSNLNWDIRFFYPYEVQVVDTNSHQDNTKGSASHEEYKRAQLKSALNRVFKSLLQFKQMSEL